MQGFILAASQEDRLPPLTRNRPLAMLPIADQPLLIHQVQMLAAGGIKRIWVHHERLTDGVKSLCAKGRRWGVELLTPAQPQSCGDAYALQQADRWLTETCVVLPGDMLTDVDLDGAIELHQKRRAAITLVVHAAVRGYDRQPVQCREDGSILAIGDEAGAGCLQYTGVALVEPAALARAAVQAQGDVFRDVVPALMAAGQPVVACVSSGYWNPLNSLQAYADAQQDVLYSAWSEHTQQAPGLPDGQPFIRHPAIASTAIASGVWVGPRNAIHPSVRITPPVYVGQNALIGQDAELGPGAVICSDVIIDDQATVKDAVVLPNTYVGRLVNLDRRLADRARLIDPQSSETVGVVDRFLLSDYTPAFAGAPLRRLGDIAGALGMIVLTSPFALAAAVVAFFSSRGRLLRNERCAAAVPDASPGTVERAQLPMPIFDLRRFDTRRPDGAPSAAGRFISAWELDRLPELWSVLSGQLSLVGIKPLPPEVVSTLTDEWEMKRFECKPGFTGLWYLRTDANSSLEEVLLADTEYATSRNWRMDIRLFLQTPGAWFRRGRSARRPAAGA